MTFLTYFLSYCAIGFALTGALYVREWWLTRDFSVPMPLAERLKFWPLGALLWPLFLWPLLRHGLPKFEDKPESPLVRMAGLREKSLRDFKRKIPPCSSIIRMEAANYPNNEESVGVLYLPAEPALQELSDRARKFDLGGDDEGKLIKWLTQRQPADPKPTDVPIGLMRFSICANALLRQGHGEAECLTCRQTYPAPALTFRDGTVVGKSSWNEAFCPNGHLLLKDLRLRFF